MKSRLLSIFFVVFMTISVCAVTAHADSYWNHAMWVEVVNGNEDAYVDFASHWTTYISGSSMIDVGGLDNLMDMMIELNSDGISCRISVVLVDNVNYYALRGVGSVSVGNHTFSLSDKYYTSGSGVFYCDSSDVTIIDRLNSIYSYMFYTMDGVLDNVVSRLDGVNTRLDSIYVLLHDTFSPFLARIVIASEDTTTIVRGTYLWLQDSETGLLYYLNLLNTNGTANIAHMDRIYDLLHDSINSLLARITNASESTNIIVRSSYFLLNDNLTTSLTTINQSIQALGSTGSGTVTNNWTVDNSDVISRIDVFQTALLEKLDTMSNGVTTSIDNTVVNITNQSDKYNVFYVTDPEGNTKSVVDLSGDLLGVGGKLLDFLYKAVFSDALDNSGDALGNMSDFYLGTGEGSGDIWGS